ncbi:HNH endonuclease [Paractinoplanes hotanensis]|uniref:HNH endonuclease n=1 Tax=Paractinoplanes hotanensis TaxID=2906497 RepID=A0ABT0YBW9_9ACTN|nr:HNH endonuclease signature motif containing protein [Actinoplanes hotanensis]MCM4083558.1 HNH endonuclease [Actinoplanes hotanensis]
MIGPAARQLSHTSTTTSATVRYLPSGDNTVLRDALYEAWGRRCHVCLRPKAFQEIQIDHLIAHTTAAADLQRLKQQHGLPDDFDLHAPANLAPACGDCNGQKGIHVLGPGLLDIRLRKAATRESEVSAAVQSFATTHAVGRSLRVLRTLDLSDPAARAAFEQHAPAVVQELALLDESKADYLVTRSLDLIRSVNVDLSYADLAVDLILDARGRTSAAIIEEIGGCPLATALGPAVDGLAVQVRSHARAGLEAPDVEVVCFIAPVVDGVALSVAHLNCIDLRLTIETVNVERDGATLCANFGGRFRCGFRGSVVRSTLSGHSEEWNGEVGTAGQLRINCGWDLTAGLGSPQTLTIEITGWDHFKALVWAARPKLLSTHKNWNG